VEKRIRSSPKIPNFLSWACIFFLFTWVVLLFIGTAFDDRRLRAVGVLPGLCWMLMLLYITVKYRPLRRHTTMESVTNNKTIAIHSWNGHRIEIWVRSTPRYLWMAMGFFVRIDDKDVFSPPECFEWSRTATTFSISDDNQIMDGKVESVPGFGNKTVLRTLYRLTVGGDKVAEGVLKSENWYLTLGFFGIIFVVIPLVIAFLSRPTF
jgi:hypothetical protein